MRCTAQVTRPGREYPRFGALSSFMDHKVSVQGSKVFDESTSHVRAFLFFLSIVFVSLIATTCQRGSFMIASPLRGSDRAVNPEYVFDD